MLLFSESWKSNNIGIKEFDKFLAAALHKSRNRIYKKQEYSQKIAEKSSGMLTIFTLSKWGLLINEINKMMLSALPI